MLNIKSLSLPPALLKSIAEIDEFKGYWLALETYTTRLQFIGDVAAHQKSFKAVFDAFRDKPLDEAILGKLNMIVTGSPEYGSYRTDAFPLVVQDGDTMIGSLDAAAPEDVPLMMPKLMDWLEKSLADKAVHPLLTIGVFACVFLQICPYARGNQRLVRLLITLLMFRAGYSYVPYILLDAPAGYSAKLYYKSLEAVQVGLDQGKPQWGVWLDYFVMVLTAQKQQLSRRLEEERDAITTLPELSAKIMVLFEEHDRLQMKEIERLTRGRRATLKLRLGELVEGGYLKRHGQARSTWYSLL